MIWERPWRWASGGASTCGRGGCLGRRTGRGASGWSGSIAWPPIRDACGVSWPCLGSRPACWPAAPTTTVSAAIGGAGRPSETAARRCRPRRPDALPGERLLRRGQPRRRSHPRGHAAGSRSPRPCGRGQRALVRSRRHRRATRCRGHLHQPAAPLAPGGGDPALPSGHQWRRQLLARSRLRPVRRVIPDGAKVGCGRSPTSFRW